MAKHIAIITVVYNNYTILEDFTSSLRAQSNQEYHLYIADASEHKQEIMLKDIPHTVISVENKGYAYGVNECIQQAVIDNIKEFCIINDDVFFDALFVKNLHQGFQAHPDSIFGGKIYYASGYEYHKKIYQPDELGKVIWYAGGSVDWNNAITKHRGVDMVDPKLFEKIENTDFITGCFMCFDSEVVDKIGFWDEKYFLYYEDADYCERAKKHNIKLWYDPSIVIWHKNAQSTDGSGSVTHQKYQKKAQMRFALKYAPLRTKLHVLKNFLL